jgi:predicted transcriptional regulator
MAADKDETAALSFRVPVQLKAELQKLADADRRALSPYLVIALEKHVGEENAKAKKR